MTRPEVAALLERFAEEVRRLPGVSRHNPHVFAEAKSELAGAMRRSAKEFRQGQSQAQASLAQASLAQASLAQASEDPKNAPVSRRTIVPGTRLIGRREIRVETRRRA